MEYTITVNDKAVIYRDKRQSMLTCLEQANIEVDFHCRDGFCGACRIKLSQGQVIYPQGEPLAFVADGEVLACCCKPASDITILIE